MPTELELVAEEASTCTRCGLAAGRTNVVFGRGDPTADLMFIGEAPGQQEDEQGVPFVGRSGQLLSKLVWEEMGIVREERAYTCNTLKCLRYDAKVQLGDGSYERIGRLVHARYDGDVMSVDEAGRLVRRKVTGWHVTPLGGRRVFRLTYRHAKRAGLGKVSIRMTGDHQVLTRRGWVRVDELRRGDQIATGQGFSAVALDVLCGVLLGDAHLPAKSSALSITHGAGQRDYADFLAEVLHELRPVLTTYHVAAVVGGPKHHEVVNLRTPAHRALRRLRAEFYPAGVKRVPAWAAQSLNPRVMAVWFMDDGHTRIRPGRKPISEIAACGFEDADVDLLCQWLEDWGVPGRRTTRNRISFGAAATRRLSQLIAPYMPPSMRYKLHPDIEASIPYDASRWSVGDVHTWYDDVEVTEETDRHEAKQPPFFCLDVDDTHNFVTTAGVVHNCRPPGNRDPLPDETEACSPYLARQIELIAPRVIVTLGNPATRYVLETREGITKLRGRTHPHPSGAVVVPTFHPAAVLRGGAETMAQTRADLVRAKLVLQGAFAS